MSDKFALPSELTIYGVAETRDALLAWLSTQGDATNGRAEIFAGDVAEIDGAGLQLLVSLSNALPNWRLVDASDALVDACCTIGLAQWLDKCTPAGDGQANNSQGSHSQANDGQVSSGQGNRA